MMYQENETFTQAYNDTIISTENTSVDTLTYGLHEINLTAGEQTTVANSSISVLALKPDIVARSMSVVSIQREPVKINYKTKTNNTPDWVFILIIGSFATIAYLRRIFPDTINKFITAIYSRHMASILQREVSPSSVRASLILNILYVYNFSLLLFIMLKRFNLKIPINGSFLQYLVILLLTSAYFLIKQLSFNIVGNVFNLKEIGHNYLYNFLIFSKVAGIAILPFIVIIPYVNQAFAVYFAYGATIIVSVLFLMRIIKGFVIIMQKVFSIFYLFLYFCTLEILPLLVLFNYLIKQGIR